jgi:trk system potassium uptake protein TrkH
LSRTRSTRSKARGSNPPGQPARRPSGAPWWALAAYVGLIVLGAIVLYLPISMPRGQQLSFDRASFLAFNAATLCGFGSTRGIEEMRVPGRAVMLILTWAGTIFTWTIGGMALCRVLRLRFDDRTILATSVLLTSILAVGAAIPLKFAGFDAYSAILTGSGAIANSGLTAGQAPLASSASFHLLLMPLAVLGGFGVVAVLEAYDALFNGRAISRHLRIAVVWSAGVYLIGTLALLLLLDPPRVGWINGIDRSLMLASAGAIDARSAGFPLPLEQFPRAGQWVLLMLMVLGALPGGTGGGLKLTTLPLLIEGARDTWAGRNVSRAFVLALLWLMSLLGLIVLVTPILMSTDPQLPGDRVLFMVVSAASTTGLAHDPISITGPGLYILSVTMLVGRCLPLVFVWWQATINDEEEPIALG